MPAVFLTAAYNSRTRANAVNSAAFIGLLPGTLPAAISHVMNAAPHSVPFTAYLLLPRVWSPLWTMAGPSCSAMRANGTSPWMRAQTGERQLSAVAYLSSVTQATSSLPHEHTSYGGAS